MRNPPRAWHEHHVDYLSRRRPVTGPAACLRREVWLNWTIMLATPNDSLEGYPELLEVSTIPKAEQEAVADPDGRPGLALSDYA